MPTRRQKAAAEHLAITEQPIIGIQAGQGNATTSPTESTEIPVNGARESIGGRLRKRRRTEYSRPEESPSSSKSVQSGNVALTADQQCQNPATSTPGQQGAQETATEVANSSAGVNQSVLATHTGESIDPQQPSSRDLEDGGQDAPDFNTVIADLINHGETVDTRYATRYYDEHMTENGEFQHMSASFTLKAQSLPVLENLATQVLEIMARSTYHEILSIATKPDTDPGQAYATLKSLFDHTKKIYSVQEPFLNPYELGLIDNHQIDIIRKTNMATFVSSVFGSQDVGFYHLNENFLDTFIADGSRLLKSQAQLYLELKTQAYISAVQNTDRSREEILEDLFPPNMEEILLKRRTGAKQLAPSEAEFIQRARNRRRALLEEATNPEAIQRLPDKYLWEAFLRDVSAYVSKNFEVITGISAPKPARLVRPSNSSGSEEKEHTRPDRRQSRLPHNEPSQQAGIDASQIESQLVQASLARVSPIPVSQGNVAEKAAEAAQYAMQDFNTNPSSVLPQHPHYHAQSSMENDVSETSQQTTKHDTPQIQYHFEHPLHPNVPAPPLPYYQNSPYETSGHLHQHWNGQAPGQLHQTFSLQNGVPYPTQSAPTHILYERARMAATAKTSPNNRRAGHPSQRRPWTTEEESSLMAGLDRVKGPHWSQILAMFGPGGTINEVLKDRNQVQLKDKARNLKLFFLKSGIEVPYYLQFVTGELKTRAPARAAKNEAEKKGSTDEDRAHIEGLMALASRPPNENDQVMDDSGTQMGGGLPNGHVPTADMGIGPRADASSGKEVPIDPQVTGEASGRIDMPAFSTNAVPEATMVQS